MSTVTSAVKVATQGKLPLAEGSVVNLLTLQQLAESAETDIAAVFP